MSKEYPTKQILAAIVLLIFIVGGGYLKLREYFLPVAAIKIAGQTLRVELAKTPAAWQKGLGGREKLKEGEGMLFVFPHSGRQAMWMKDMKFPIDIIWIDEGVVVDIAPNVSPTGKDVQNPPIYLPRAPAAGVLEVNVGFSQKYGLKIGDAVELFKK